MPKKFSIAARRNYLVVGPREIDTDFRVRAPPTGFGQRSTDRVADVFAKTRQRERLEIARANRAMEHCIAEGHTTEEPT